MGRRGRARTRGGAPRAPTTNYEDPGGNVLTLRGSMTAKTRSRYAAILGGDPGTVRPATTREDEWQRAVEFLFERLAVRWVIAGVETDRQQELLARFRAASPDERHWVRDVLRKHVAENFPELEAP